MKKLVLLVGVLLTFTACKETLQGELRVYKAFNYLDMKGLGQLLPLGNYKDYSSITFKSNSSAVLELVDQDTWDRFWIPMNVPSKLMDPNFEGRFNVTPTELGQPFGLEGMTAFNAAVSGPFQSVDECILGTYKKWVCDYYGDHQPKCHWETYYEYGKTEVTYEIHEISKDLVIRLVSAQDRRDTYASFQRSFPMGQKRVIKSQTACH